MRTPYFTTDDVFAHIEALIVEASSNIEKEGDFEKSKNMSKLKDVKEFIEKNV